MIKGVLLKHKAIVEVVDNQVGQATETVLGFSKLEESRPIVIFSMLSDMATYSLEILAVFLFWRMVIGQIPINLQSITTLWTAAIAVHIAFQSVFGLCECCTAYLRGHEGNCWSIVLYFLWRISSPVGVLYLIHKYTPQLQAILDKINTPTALFDLYYNSEQSFPVPAGFLGWDLISILSTALIVPFLCALCCVSSPCIIYRYCKQRGNSDKLSPPGADVQYSTSKVQFLFSAPLAIKSLWMKEMFNFDDIVFSIFVAAVRLSYDTNNVVFFHQLLRKLPVFFYIMAIVSFGCHILTRIFVSRTSSGKKYRESLPPTDRLAFVKHLVLLVGAIWFLKIRLSNPTLSIQLFFVVLICERSLLLVRNLWLGFSRLVLGKPRSARACADLSTLNFDPLETAEKV